MLKLSVCAMVVMAAMIGVHSGPSSPIPSTISRRTRSKVEANPNVTFP